MHDQSCVVGSHAQPSTDPVPTQLLPSAQPTREQSRFDGGGPQLGSLHRLPKQQLASLQPGGHWNPAQQTMPAPHSALERHSLLGVHQVQPLRLIALKSSRQRVAVGQAVQTSLVQTVPVTQSSSRAQASPSAPFAEGPASGSSATS